MVFARSNRPTRLLAAGAAGVAVVLGAATLALLLAHDDLAALVAGMLAVVALAAVARTVRRLRRWPTGRLGFFHDRLVLVKGRTELQAPWQLVETVTLADQGDWSAGRWPELHLTDRLTVRLRPSSRFSFRPASFGVDPAACRDLILRLRDEPSLRRRLPEFDSILDLTSRPLQTGQLIRPNIWRS